MMVGWFAKDLQLECAKVLHERLLVHGLKYGNETMLWKEKERFRIRAVQICPSEVCWV